MAAFDQFDPTRRRLLIGRRGLLRAGLAGAMAGLAGSRVSRPAFAQSGDAAEVEVEGENGAHRFMRIGTGSTTGYYFPVGGLIANAISRPHGSRPCDRGGSCGVPGLIAVAQSTHGSVDNIARLAAGTLDLALTQADIAYWARSGTAVYEDTGPMPELVALARLYDERVHLVVRADSLIHRLEDLRGKRVALGAAGSGTLVDARLLLQAHGLSESDLVPLYDQPGPSADLLVAGELDAFFFIGAAPVTVVSDVAGTIPIRLVPLDGPAVEEMVDRHPYMTLGSIPGGVYDGQALPVPTISVGAVLVTTTAMDDAMAEAITRALWHPNARPVLRAAASDAMMLDPALAPHGTGIPLHPGAQRYYESAGYLP
jgi:TRAP transporter TAXI family solute receptor